MLVDLLKAYVPGMLRHRGQYGLEAKFCDLGLGLVGFDRSLVLGLLKPRPHSHVSWPRGLNNYRASAYCSTAADARY